MTNNTNTNKTETERYFTVSCNDRSYAVIGNERATLDTVWAAQKCFFSPTSVVRITDDKGNSKVFLAMMR